MNSENQFFKFFGSQLYFWIFISILLSSVLLLWIATLYYPFIGKDGSSYLSIGRDVFTKNIGIYNMDVQYNPLGIYIYGLPYLFINQNVHVYSLLLVFFISILNLIVFYRILGFLKIKTNIKIFSVSLFIFYYTLIGGTYIYLETVTLFFLLLTVLQFLKEKYIVAGMFLFLAFYCKQYALTLALPMSIFIFYKTSINKAFKNSFRIILGFFLVLISFFIIHSDQIEFSTYLLRLMGKANLDGFVQHTGIGLTLGGSIMDFLKVMLFCLFIPFSFFLLFSVKFSKILLFFFVAFLSSLLSLIFSTYVYYYLLIIPWILFVLAIILDKVELNPLRNIFRILVVLTTLSSFYILKIILTKKEKLEYVNEQVKLMEKHVPINSKVYLFIDPIYYYYASYYSVNNKKLGYRFPKGKKFEYIIKSVTKDSYIIIENAKFLKAKEDFNNNFLIVGSDEQNTYIKKI